MTSHLGRPQAPSIHPTLGLGNQAWSSRQAALRKWKCSPSLRAIKVHSEVLQHI